MKWCLIWAIALTCLGFGVRVSAQHTCGCFSKEPANASLEQKIKYHVKHSEAVFSGSVVEINEIKSGVFKGNLAVRFEVERAWKNARSKFIVVLTSPSVRRSSPPLSENCGYNFQLGKTYLVYVELKSGPNLITGACSRTRELETGKQDLKILSEMVN